jgi:hypothetical protein
MQTKSYMGFLTILMGIVAGSQSAIADTYRAPTSAIQMPAQMGNSTLPTPSAIGQTRSMVTAPTLLGNQFMPSSQSISVRGFVGLDRVVQPAFQNVNVRQSFDRARIRIGGSAVILPPAPGVDTPPVPPVPEGSGRNRPGL